MADVYQAHYRHALYYYHRLRLAHQLYRQGGDSLMDGLALFDRERVNIEAAQGQVAAGSAQHEAMLRLCTMYPDAAALLLEIRLTPDQRVRWLEDAVHAARQLDVREAEARHLGNTGLAYADLGETHKAIECFEAALTLQRQLGNRRGEAAQLGNLGLAYAYLSQTRRAIEFHKQCLAIYRDLNDPGAMANALGNLGLAHSDLGEMRPAIRYFEQCLPKLNCSSVPFDLTTHSRETSRR
jgi:tetratricopeptide (TPR) repeat protein